MKLPSRRDLLRVASLQALASVPASQAFAGPIRTRMAANRGMVAGNMTGARAMVEALKLEGTECVFGIPGAQQNELWDTLKAAHLPYMLVTHEFSASTMADGYARATGKPGVMCVVPGPGLTNSLTGLGEALLDSIPMLAIVGDVANGHDAHAFQVHCLNQQALLAPVTKRVYCVENVAQIPDTIREAYHLACAGEPGPVGVVVPYNLLIEAHRFNSGPHAPMALPWDEQAANHAFSILEDRRLRIGIYAGQGCMNYAPAVTQLAEVLQAPVATSMAGKGVIPETHPLSVGWGYGPQGTRTAEEAFRNVDVVLAMGVKFSEVSTGFYSLPQHRCMIHVDVNQHNLGRVMRSSACVHADAGLFLSQAIERAPFLQRDENCQLTANIRRCRQNEARANSGNTGRCGVDPMAFICALRRVTHPDCMACVDVTMSQYWATEAFTANQPRTFFNPTNNQGMGWSIPAALGAQRAFPGRQTVTITGDGCFLMSAMEISTAARAGLPVKFFVLDDQAYHYMQELQRPAYMRTTATILANLDYRSLASGLNIPYHEINGPADLDAYVLGALQHDGPILTRVRTDYGRRQIRWLRAARARYTQGLTSQQRLRFMTRIGYRALDPTPEND